MTFRTMTLRKSILLLISLSMIAALVACSSSSSTPPVITTTPTISLTTTPSPTPTTLIAGGTLSLTATITNDTSGANWAATCGSTTAGACGTFSAPNTASGTAVTYTAPTTIPPAAVVITATVADHTSVTAFTSGITITAGAPANLAISSGNNQSVAISTGFAPLVAQVTDGNGNPVQGVTVTFTANTGGTGASGTFTSTASNVEAPTTDVNGNATVSDLVANATLGAFTVTASSTGLTSVNFTETNTAVVVSSNTYVFYASGQELTNGGPNYYAIAGAVTIDALGDILGGEQDYNDAFGFTFFDQIPPASAALSVDPGTGQGTLTINVSATDTSVGNAGIETFAVQFVNANHALITQFDGSATSSGSLDLQTATTTSGNFAFALSGVDTSYQSVAYGGVYTASGGTTNGTLDINDDGAVILGTPFTATSTADGLGFGRFIVTGVTNPVTAAPITFASYVVGPEVLRIIDIDANDSAVGSAYGQGSATFTNANFPSPTSASGVFTLLGQWTQYYATLGEFATDSNGNFTGGAADDNELDIGTQQEAAPISGSTYDLISSGINGYGSITVNWNGTNPTPDVTSLGLYAVDPTLNINDPNNSSSADVGGALIIDLDAVLPGGIGVITPQTNAAVSAFNGTYVAGFQDFNAFASCFCEFDMISQGTMTSGAALSLTGTDNDPFGTWDGTPAESTDDTFTSTPLNVGTGIYSMSAANNPANEIEATINFAVTGGPGTLDADIYQASGTTLYWLEFDNNGVFLGPIEAQGSLTGVPAAKKPAAKKPNQNKNAKPIQGLGGTLR